MQQFQTTLDRMKEAQNIGKSIAYRLGYSNFAFELWIILHKADCNGALAGRTKYLAHLNRAYGEHFESLDEYKRENNFKRLLCSLTLEHVSQAVQRSKVINARNEATGCVLHQYKGYRYYKENPALSIWESIEKIFSDCNL